MDADRKDIFLTNNPNEVVLTTLFSQQIKSYKVKPYIVTTIEGQL